MNSLNSIAQCRHWRPTKLSFSLLSHGSEIESISYWLSPSAFSRPSCCSCVLNTTTWGEKQLKIGWTLKISEMSVSTCFLNRGDLEHHLTTAAWDLRRACFLIKGNLNIFPWEFPNIPCGTEAGTEMWLLLYDRQLDLKPEPHTDIQEEYTCLLMLGVERIWGVWRQVSLSIYYGTGKVGCNNLWCEGKRTTYCLPAVDQAVCWALSVRTWQNGVWPHF